MKLISTLLFCLFITVFLHAQQSPIGKYFELIPNVTLNHCDAVGKSTGSSDIILGGIQFRVVAETTADYVIYVLRKDKDNAFNAQYYNKAYKATGTDFVAPTKASIYFLLPKNSFPTICKPRLDKNSFTIGIMSLPLKMRFGSKVKVDSIYDKNFLVTNDVSLGFSVGYKRKWTESWGMSLLGGVALSTIQLDSSLTKGYIKSATNNTAVTVHAGLLLEVDNFQFGLFTGVDYLTGQAAKTWIYERKPWLGLAIGYSLFKSKSRTDTQ